MLDLNALKIDALKGLNEPQKAAAQITEGPLLITAGAGSGKTRVLTHRIAYMIDTKDIPAGEILAITFTRKAAQEMKDRLAKLLKPSDALQVMASTFHGVCGRILRENAGLANLQENFSVADDTMQLTEMKQVMSGMGMSKKEGRRVIWDYQPQDLLSLISMAKNHLVTPRQSKTYWMDHKNSSDFGFGGAYPDFDQVQEVYMKYQQQLAQDNLIDYDDMIMKTVQLFQQHENVLKFYQEKWQYLSVDEYQDTNDAQYEFVYLLAGKRQNLCVVGDADQGIYGWRGANIQNILDFHADFPNAKEVKLEQNYRSTKNIVAAANRLIKHNQKRQDKKLWTSNEAGQPVALCELYDDNQEIDWVINQAQKLIAKGVNPKEIAIMYRSNRISRKLDRTMIKRHVPHIIVNGTDFYARKEVQDILAYLRLTVNPDSSPDIVRIAGVPSRGVGAKTIDQAENVMNMVNKSLWHVMNSQKFQDSLGKASHNHVAKFMSDLQWLQNFAQTGGFGAEGVAAYIEQLKDTVKVDTWFKDKKGKKTVDHDKDNQDEDREANVNEVFDALMEFVKEQETPDSMTVAELIQGYLMDVASQKTMDDNNKNKNGIQLLTIHASKGLEFEYVFVMRANNGVYPNNYVKSQDDMEEERRLAYVATTRAKKGLYWTYCLNAMTYQGPQAMQPNIFLGEMEGQGTVGIHIERRMANGQAKWYYEQGRLEN